MDKKLRDIFCYTFLEPIVADGVQKKIILGSFGTRIPKVGILI